MKKYNISVLVSCVNNNGEFDSEYIPYGKGIYNDDELNKILANNYKLMPGYPNSYGVSMYSDDNGCKILVEEAADLSSEDLGYPTKGYTHAGIFHADEVFGVAFLRIINPVIEITRGFNPPAEDPEVLVFDIGGGEFDHHTLPREERANGVPYAAFGKLWRTFAPDYFGEVVANKLDAKLVQEIDAIDNGVEGAQSNISRFIHELNPLWNEDCSSDDQFWLAVDYASVILKREIQSIQAIVEAEEEVKKAADAREHEGILVLEKYVPWISYVISEYPEVMYTIFPSVRGGWSMQVVPLSNETKAPRKDVLDSWKGFRAGNGVEAPIKGMTFCHPTGFLSSFETKEQAIAAAKYIIDRG